MSTATKPLPETVIRANRQWLSLDLRELVAYRDLLRLLVWRDFIAKYKQTVLGPVWFILQPVLTTAVFVVVFGRVMKIPTDGLPPMLFYLCGLLGWNYFSMTFTNVSGTFLNNAPLFGKVYFPRTIVPLANTISGLWAFLLNAVILGLFILYFALTQNWAPSIGFTALLLPFIVLQIAAIGLGGGLWMAVLTAKYRDFSHLTAFLTQILLYATPVIYPLSHVEGKLRTIAECNPLAFPLEALKEIFLGTSEISTGLALPSILFTMILLVSGLFAFHRTQRTFIDTI